MNREQFYARVSVLDAEQPRKILWTLYWRGTAAYLSALDAFSREESSRAGEASMRGSRGVE